MIIEKLTEELLKAKKDKKNAHLNEDKHFFTGKILAFTSAIKIALNNK